MTITTDSNWRRAAAHEGNPDDGDNSGEEDESLEQRGCWDDDCDGLLWSFQGKTVCEDCGLTNQGSQGGHAHHSRGTPSSVREPGGVSGEHPFVESTPDGKQRKTYSDDQTVILEGGFAYYTGRAHWSDG